MSNTIIRDTAERLVAAMKALENGQMDPEHAKAICLCGKTIIDAQNSELRVIHELKALQQGGMISDKLQYLEPNVELPRPAPKKIAGSIASAYDGEFN